MKYVFDNPDAMLHWIEGTIKKLLTIRRKDFGTISVELRREKDGVKYEWLVDEKDKQLWERSLNEER